MKARHILAPCIITIIVLFGLPSASFAQALTDPPDDETVIASPKAGWSLPIPPQEASEPWWAQVLLWVPNRAMDFIDIFRIDVGVGPAIGGVVRLTQYGQIGYREMLPMSFRVGDFGRYSPVVLESSDEFGAGPGYVHSKDRRVCSGEIGAGADVLIVGAYGGVCLDEFVDFVAGIFFIDLKGDDM